MASLVVGLLGLKTQMESIVVRLHDQEHCWEYAQYPKLESVWDEANRDVWNKMHHCILKRALKLGATLPATTTEPISAYQAAISDFNSIHEACQALYDIADRDDDYVTIALLAKVQRKVESWIAYLEGKLAQVTRAEQPGGEFLAEQY